MTGFSLFPLLPETKTPAVAWDTFKTGARRATPDEITDWRSRRYNLAVATGAVSGCIVLDCDSMTAWAEAYERGVPDTFTVTTPRGWHLYFAHPGAHVGNRAKLGGVAGWDIRGDGGYVVGPGSHYTPSDEDAAKGKLAGAYAVEQDLPLAPAPQWLLDLLVRDVVPQPTAPYSECEQTTPYGRSALNGALADLAAAQEGVNLSDAIYVAAARIGELVAGGEIQYVEGWESLEEALRVHGVDGQVKALGTLTRGWEKGWANPKAAPERTMLTADALFGTREPLLEDGQINGDQHLLVPEPPTPFGPHNTSATTVLPSEIASHFRDCVYVAADNAIWVPGGVMLKRDAFNVIYGGPEYSMDAEAGKTSKSAWDAFSTNAVVRMPRAARTVFRPEEGAGNILQLEGLPVLNAYVPIHTARAAGDPGPFTRHIAKLLPAGNDAEILLHWMASCVQNPGAKFQWWPVVQGVKGNGKTLLLDVMTAAVGERYSHLVNSEALQRTGNQFNAWIDRKLFLGFEEIHTGEGQHHFTDMMKTTVTNRRIAAEGKGVAQGTVDNRANGMMLTNHDDSVPIDDEERRYGIFYTAQQIKADFVRDGMDGDYFPNLWDWMRAGGFAIVNNYLRTYPLKAALDPARGWKAPVTTSTPAAKVNSLGNVELEVLDRIEQGAPGFRGGWISSVMFGAVMERMRIGRKRWPAILKSLGYEPHPNLKDGRVSAALADTTKPRLYIAKGHPAAGLQGQAIGDAFEAAQNGVATSNVVAFPRP